MYVGSAARNQQNEANNSDEAEEYHEGSTLLGPVGEVSPSNSSYTAENIGRNAHQLRLVVGVAHVLDDGGEEERDRVEGGVDAYKTVLVQYVENVRREELPMVISM